MHNILILSFTCEFQTNYAPDCYIADSLDAGCQTELTMDDIEKMEDVLRQNTTELGDLRTKALDAQFNQESFEKNEDKTKFYTGFPTSWF